MSGKNKSTQIATFKSSEGASHRKRQLQSASVYLEAAEVCFVQNQEGARAVVVLHSWIWLHLFSKGIKFVVLSKCKQISPPDEATSVLCSKHLVQTSGPFSIQQMVLSTFLSAWIDVKIYLRTKRTGGGDLESIKRKVSASGLRFGFPIAVACIVSCSSFTREKWRKIRWCEALWWVSSLHSLHSQMFCVCWNTPWYLVIELWNHSLWERDLRSWNHRMVYLEGTLKIFYSSSSEPSAMHKDTSH